MAEYHDIPGTTIFDAQQSRLGYHLNMFCMSLMKADNRADFLNSPDSYLDRFPMTADQKQAVLNRDWNAMIHLGGNIYFTSKIAAADGLSFRQIAAMMSGVEESEYALMMANGGRSVDESARSERHDG
jgi:protocatechuate 4,5-dioxygenase alpha chain